MRLNRQGTNFLPKHLIIPDTQVAPGTPLDHFVWIGRAINEYKPDVLMHIGDHWDMHAASTWSAAGSKDKEGSRLQHDIDAGNEALELLEKSMEGYKPKQKIILRGNHEDRLSRLVASDPRLEGVVGFHLFNDKELGWTPVEYFNGSPNIIHIDGIAYAHYFANPNTGKPIAGTIQNRLSKIGSSFVQGHQQGLQQDNQQYATGVTRYGVVAGSCYLHDESYKGVANKHWRGIMVLNEVRNGSFCSMPLTLDYLCRKYEGMSIGQYMRKKYKNARQRFTIANED